MERALGLMAGTGELPARAAAEARRQGWRVVAFAFGEAPGLEASAERVVPCRLADIGAVLQDLGACGARAVLFVGKFWKHEAFPHVDQVHEAGLPVARGGLSDAALGQVVVSTLNGMGIEVLDQRTFLRPWLLTAPTVTARAPSEAEWEDLRSGLRLAQSLAAHGVGQTVVRFRGTTVAVEALEGTDETIRRGTRLAGRGAVVVKAPGPGHDYRFDIPAVGPTTFRTMAEGGASALAVARDQVLLINREESIQLAERAGIAVVSIDGDR